MRVIGVIDLLRGRAVHAVGGHRDQYAAVTSVAGSPIDGDAVALARRYLAVGVGELYVADLDAVGGAARQDPLLVGLAALGAPLWVDAGVTSAEQARQCLVLGASQVIVGLETLASWQALEEIRDSIGGDRVAFSLDLRNGSPLGAATVIGGGTPEALAVRAADAGAATILVLDLARVGTGNGLDTTLIARLRAAAPRVTLIAGGGVAGAGDLDRLADAGCDAALVATALHSGALRPDHGSATR